ncbi:hypothetical protein G6O69_26500 [Pseudenhygromyxa sp. WMMC2535]|uniref:hypothetical protein n=1 Tax=Pseudenhygromyxa sp. WMMC2535 TaxID=2712867 RepID=UPI0015954A29|nr:hypothetical protein [Pseudenhygromyxa sp. WMMC2535]NVB41417.1 hypothetical protein [Pseudenhygromyxa sp. WMMC2535]
MPLRIALPAARAKSVRQATLQIESPKTRLIAKLASAADFLANYIEITANFSLDASLLCTGA